MEEEKQNKQKNKKYAVVSMATQTAPVLVNNETETNYPEVSEIFAEILNRLDAIESLLKKLEDE